MTDQAADTGCRPAIIQQMQPSNLFNRLDCYGALTLRPIEHVDAPFFSNNSSDSVEYFSVDCERHWFPSSNNKDASHSGSDFPSMVIRPPSHTREAHEGGARGGERLFVVPSYGQVDESCCLELHARELRFSEEGRRRLRNRRVEKNGIRREQVERFMFQSGD